MITNLKDWKKLKLNEDAPRRMLEKDDVDKKLSGKNGPLKRRYRMEYRGGS